jgi:integrase
MRPHDLRHTHVALLIAAEENPYVISQRLGHASIKTTYDIYGHLFEGRDQEAADRLDEVARRAQTDTRRTPDGHRVIPLNP